MQPRFRFELRNRYSLLHNEKSTISEQYDALVKANEHTAKTILPLVQKTKREGFANNPRITEARKRVEKLVYSYKIKKSKVIRKLLQAAKQDLNEVYKQLEFECLDSQL